MNRSLVAALLLPFSLALVSGCADAGDAGPVVTVRDSAGIEIVEQSRIDVPRIDLGEPYLQLGSIDGEDDAFFRVTDLERLDDGSWIVANGGSVEARVFGPDGTFLRSFVQQGDGPGELSRLSGLALLENDSVFVWDLFGRRGAVFTADGELGRTLRAGDELGRFYAAPVGTVDGNIVMNGANIVANAGGEGSRMNRASIRGTILDRDAALVAELDPIPGRESWVMQRENSISDRSFPFAKTGQLTVAGDRVVTGESGSDELRVVNAEGDLAAIWRVLADPGEVSAEDWAAQRDRQLADAETDAARQAIRTMFDEMERPTRRPVWSDLLGAEDGSVWVERYAAEGESDATMWWVVSPEGEVVREVTGPADVQLLWAGADVVAGTVVDELGVEYLRFWRVGPGDSDR